MRLFLPLCVLLLGVVTLPGLAQTFNLQVVAQPSRLVFGTDNRVTLLVNVADNLGQPAPDGTAVYFHTTLGEVINTAYLKDGRVTVQLNNHAGPGVAQVTVTIGAVRRTINVEYVGPDVAGDEGDGPRRTAYTVKARQVYYSVDQRVFDLREQAQLSGANFTITAGAIQYSVNDGAIAAQQNVTITTASRSLTAHSLRMNINGTSGYLIVTDPEIAYQSFTLPDLLAVDSEVARQMEFKAIPTDPTKSWILCREASVYPAEYIIFRRPQFYVDRFDRRLYTLPYHVLSLRDSGAGLFLSGQLSLTSDAGLDVDFPVYYAANPSRIGSVHLRHVVRGSSSYRGDSGFQVGVEEEYLTKHGDGGLYLDDLTRETRSATFEHYHDFGNTSVNFNAAYDRYDADTPYTKRLGLSVYNTTGKVSSRLSANWSALEEDQDGLAELTFQLPSWNVGKLGFSFDPYLGYSRTVIGATETDPKATRSNFYQGVHAGVGFPSLKLLGGTLSPSLSDEVTRDQDGIFTNYLDAGISYRRPLGRWFNSSLNYSYSDSSSSDETATDTEASQRVSLDLSGRIGQNLSLSTYSTYNINSDLFYHSLSSTYYLPWFRKEKQNPRAYISYRANLTSSTDSISDQLMSLGWKIGQYTLVVHYSPTGNTGVTGIGTGSGKKWAVELVRQSF